MKREELVGLINDAINSGSTPVVHNNGFIQLKLSDGRRMHFWDKSIPRQTVPTLIHEHVFDMHSEIVAGCLLHCEVRVHEDDDGFYDIYEAKTVEGVQTTLVNTGHRCRVHHGQWQRFFAGDEYLFPAGQFHETSDRLGPCISIITKRRTAKNMDPCVLVEHGKAPDNEFDRRDFTLVKLLDTISRITHELLPNDAVVRSFH